MFLLIPALAMASPPTDIEAHNRAMALALSCTLQTEPTPKPECRELVAGSQDRVRFPVGLYVGYASWYGEDGSTLLFHPAGEDLVLLDGTPTWTPDGQLLVGAEVSPFDEDRMRVQAFSMEPTGPEKRMDESLETGLLWEAEYFLLASSASHAPAPDALHLLHVVPERIVYEPHTGVLRAHIDAPTLERLQACNGRQSEQPEPSAPSATVTAASSTPLCWRSCRDPSARDWPPPFWTTGPAGHSLHPMASLITRRRLLAGGAALAATSLAGGLAAFLHLPQAGPGYRVLSEREQLQVAALGQALFPPGNPLGPSFLEADGVARVDVLLDDGLHARSVKPLRYTLGALDWGARLSLGSALHLLDERDALTLLQAWSSHEAVLRRAAVDGVKSVLALAYFDHPQVLERLDFQPRCYA